jgi:dTDP-4-dehydrorhamnose reductase
MTMRVFVTGGKGQLGTALLQALKDHEVLITDVDEADITNYDAFAAAVDDFGPDVVIHGAAITDVDGCERNPDLAYRVNAIGTQNVALTCHRNGIPLVAVSTDYVFDGQKGQPYLEFDDPNPVSVYGRSKLAGERYAQMLHDKTYIVRTAWVFSEVGKNFVKTMLRLSGERESLTVVTDERGCPTYAYDLAEAIGKLIAKPQYGTYHFTNAGECSRFEFAAEIVRLAGRTTRVEPITAAEYQKLYPVPAKRPTDGRLRNFCGANAVGLELRPWREALAVVVKNLLAGA